ncbi:MAG: hypothetical protein ACI95C_003023, partial [Pseudohongiellaceae bacterium]
MKDIVDKTKFSSVKSLTRLVLSALENANLQIAAQAFKFNKTQLPPLREEGHAIAERFMTTLNGHFDALTSNTAKAPQLEVYEENLSLVDHDYLEAIIAMEGMVNHARNSDIQQYLSFTTRLDSLFENLTIDETNNPLDPEQIGESFNEAIRPLGLKAHYLLTIYREFNKAVFHNLEDVLVEANEILINLGVMPDLDMKARNREIQKAKRAANRPTTDAQTRAFSIDDIKQSQPNSAPAPDTREMFALMQTLVHGLIEKNADSKLPIQSNSVESSEDQAAMKLQQDTILSVLNSVQEKLKHSTQTNSDAAETSTEDYTGKKSAAITASINQSIEESKASGQLIIVDAQSSDVMNLVTMLYQAIWKDDSLPVAMKELIGRTQIAVMKIALTDTTFFGDVQHPARVLLNEFAMAGIAWTDPKLLASDPIYCKVKELVERILGEAAVDSDFLQSLINELRALKAGITGQDENLEQRIRQTDDHTERLDDVHAFVSQKINERIIKSNLDPSIRKLLDTYMHEFLVKLVLKEGPGGSSWKPVMSTIDVLLWTVQTEKQPGDRERFDKINPRLLDNLGKALEIGGASKSKMTKIMRQLKQVQEFSFHTHEPNKNPAKAPVTSSPEEPKQAPLPRREPAPLPRDDIHLRQVDKL